MRRWKKLILIEKKNYWFLTTLLPTLMFSLFGGDWGSAISGLATFPIWTSNFGNGDHSAAEGTHVFVMWLGERGGRVVIHSLFRRLGGGMGGLSSLQYRWKSPLNDTDNNYPQIICCMGVGGWGRIVNLSIGSLFLRRGGGVSSCIGDKEKGSS